MIRHTISHIPLPYYDCKQNNAIINTTRQYLYAIMGWEAFSAAGISLTDFFWLALEPRVYIGELNIALCFASSIPIHFLKRDVIKLKKCKI